MAKTTAATDVAPDSTDSVPAVTMDEVKAAIAQAVMELPAPLTIEDVNAAVAAAMQAHPAPHPAASMPSVGDGQWGEMKNWVRQEVELSRLGLDHDERAKRNP